jgi:hypothetical protein
MFKLRILDLSLGLRSSGGLNNHNQGRITTKCRGSFITFSDVVFIFSKVLDNNFLEILLNIQLFLFYIQLYICINIILIFLANILSLQRQGTFIAGPEKNQDPENLYHYRLVRKIEIIHVVIELIKEKNFSHLNLNLMKTQFVGLEKWIGTLVQHYSSVYENLYAQKYPLGRPFSQFGDGVDFGSQHRRKRCIRLLEIMLGSGSVEEKFSRGLKEITFSDRVNRVSKKFSFFRYHILGRTDFSEGFQNYSYVDLSLLEYFTGMIAWQLISYFCCLGKDVNLVGNNNYLIINCLSMDNYSISVNDKRHEYSGFLGNLFFDKADIPKESCTALYRLSIDAIFIARMRSEMNLGAEDLIRLKRSAKIPTATGPTPKSWIWDVLTLSTLLFDGMFVLGPPMHFGPPMYGWELMPWLLSRSKLDAVRLPLIETLPPISQSLPPIPASLDKMYRWRLATSLILSLDLKQKQKQM